MQPADTRDRQVYRDKTRFINISNGILQEMTMNRKIFIFALCALMLSGCGRTGGNADNDDVPESSTDTVSTAEKSSGESSSDKDDPSSKAEEDTDKEVLPEASDVQVAFAVANRYGGYFGGKQAASEEFYDYVKQVIATSEETARFDLSDRTLSAGFVLDGEKYALQAFDDGTFAWRAEKSKDGLICFKPDEGTAKTLRDMMLTYAAFAEMDINDAVMSDDRYTSSIVRDIDEGRSDNYTEQRYYHIDDKLCRLISIDTNGKGVYYCQTQNVEPSESRGDYYEFAADDKGNAYSRTDIEGKFLSDAGFEGEVMPLVLPEHITKNYEYQYSLKVAADGTEYTVEVWDGDEGRYYVWAEKDRGIIAAWDVNVTEGISLMETYYGGDTEDTSVIEKTIEYAEANKAENSIPTFSPKQELLDEDTEKYGLFDLSGGVVAGEEVQPTGVVEEWRDYISSGGNAFTLEFRWAGAGRNEYQISTTNGKDYYYRNDMELHRGDGEDMGSEELFVDGRFIQSIYYLDEIDKREYTEWPRYDDGDPRLPTDLLFENEKYDEDYHGECKKAYKVMVGGEEYICEEWSLYLDRLWKVYIKDGNIVAWEGDFYNDPTVNTVIRLEKTADESLLKIPDGTQKYQPDPLEQNR